MAAKGLQGTLNGDPEPEPPGKLFRCAGTCWKLYPEAELVVVSEPFAGKGFRCAACKEREEWGL